MKIKCWFGFHNLEVTRKLGAATRLIHCVRCKGYWGMNDDVEIVLPFDDELYKMYSRYFQIKGLKKYISYKRWTLFF